MPKYSREMEEKIVALFEQGKRNSVISRELNIYRGALPIRRKEWEKRKKEEEKPETELEKTNQQKQTIDPQKYMRAPINHRTPPSQITELEKRISELEKSQRGPNPSLLDKRISKLEGAQQVINPSLLKKKISKLEKSQRESKRSFDTLLRDFQNMQDELLESAERRLTDEDVCKHVQKDGFCLLYYFSYDEVVNSEYFKPMGYGEKEGKKVYYINVKKHPIVCSACPDYERNS